MSYIVFKLREDKKEVELQPLDHSYLMLACIRRLSSLVEFSVVSTQVALSYRKKLVVEDCISVRDGIFDALRCCPGTPGL